MKVSVGMPIWYIPLRKLFKLKDANLSISKRYWLITM
jgi:hypothetical protein